MVPEALSLLPGSRLGPYEIVSPLGAGGMGEVYRARDARLKRDVAVKVLPADVAGNPERLGRFERESHMLASLNHPHIAAIYGVEESGGTPALVMELVEGESLAEKIARGPLPVDDATPLGIDWRRSAARSPRRREFDTCQGRSKIDPSAPARARGRDRCGRSAADRAAARRD